MEPTRYEVGESERQAIELAFNRHPIKNDQEQRYEALRMQAKAAAELILSLCPPSRERSLAMTRLEECWL